MRRKRNTFDSVGVVTHPRSTFDLSHGYQTAFDPSYLYPVACWEVLPGDTWNVQYDNFTRLNTLAVPVMHDCTVTFHFFFCANRLVMDDWEKFQGAQDNPNDWTEYVLPTLTTQVGVAAEGRLPDFFGITTQAALDVNSLPFRHYNNVFNEWYLDQDLQTKKVVDRDNGPDAESDYILLKRNKQKDYFTTAAPRTLKAQNPVSLPLGTTAPLISDTTNPNMEFTVGINTGVRMTGVSSSTANVWSQTITSSGDAVPEHLGMVTDLSAATGATINALRDAALTQQYLELNMRAGTRYTERLMAMWGVRGEDFRLQRPEYIGGGVQTVKTHQAVASNQSANVDLGELGGYGTSNGSVRFNYSAVEHGYIIGLMSARASLKYQQGAHAQWFRDTRFAFYEPIFANIGEQPIYNREIYAQGSTADTDVFGYKPPWSEYHYLPSLVTGKLRSNVFGSLDVWTWAEDFSSLPALNEAFIQDASPISRALSAPSEPAFLTEGWFTINCARRMPMHATPGIRKF